MDRLLAKFLFASAVLLTGCAASPGDRYAVIIGVGIVRVSPPADGARFDLVGVAALAHPAFTGVAAGAVVHQSVAIGFD